MDPARRCCSAGMEAAAAHDQGSAGVPLWRQVFRLLHDIPSSLHKPHAYKQLELIHCHFLLLSPHIIKANFSQEFNWRQRTSLPAVLSPQYKLWVSIGSIEMKYEERTPCLVLSLALPCSPSTLLLHLESSKSLCPQHTLQTHLTFRVHW